MSDARLEAATEVLTRIYADEGIVRFTLPSVAAAVLEAADAEERGLADQLAAALSIAWDVIGGYRNLSIDDAEQIEAALARGSSVRTQESASEAK